MLKISIITATLNSAKTISSTLDSILAQDYKHIEHIIVDGKSSDKTLKVIESYRPKYEKRDFILTISSQKDSGIYDAFNRGISLANGEVIGFLNADDFFANNHVLSLVAWGFSKPFINEKRVNIVYANVKYVNERLDCIRDLRAKSFQKIDFKLGLHPPHPSFYVRAELFKQFGAFRLKYRIASDYELMLRFLYKLEIESLYIDECFVKMRIGGVSNASLKNIFNANVECFEAWRDNDLSALPLFVLFKPLRKLLDLRYKGLLRRMLRKPIRGGADLRFYFYAWGDSTSTGYCTCNDFCGSASPRNTCGTRQSAPHSLISHFLKSDVSEANENPQNSSTILECQEGVSSLGNHLQSETIAQNEVFLVNTRIIDSKTIAESKSDSESATIEENSPSLAEGARGWVESLDSKSDSESDSSSLRGSSVSQNEAIHCHTEESEATEVSKNKDFAHLRIDTSASPQYDNVEYSLLKKLRRCLVFTKRTSSLPDFSLKRSFFRKDEFAQQKPTQEANSKNFDESIDFLKKSKPHIATGFPNTECERIFRQISWLLSAGQRDRTNSSSRQPKRRICEICQKANAQERVAHAA